MLRLCVQNGREFSIKKGNQNNLFCLNTEKNDVCGPAVQYTYMSHNTRMSTYFQTHNLTVYHVVYGAR